MKKQKTQLEYREAMFKKLEKENKVLREELNTLSKNMLHYFTTIIAKSPDISLLQLQQYLIRHFYPMFHQVCEKNKQVILRIVETLDNDRETETIFIEDDIDNEVLDNVREIFIAFISEFEMEVHGALIVVKNRLQDLTTDPNIIIKAFNMYQCLISHEYSDEAIRQCLS